MADSPSLLPAVRDGEALNLGAFSLSRLGLLVHGRPSFDEWARCGAFLQHVNGAVQWWVGDWLNFGEAVYGEKYSQALEATGYQEQTLTNYAYVARHVEISRRREDVPYSVHAEVASLAGADQSAVLESAASEGWSVWQARAAVRLRKRGEPGAELPERYVLEIPADLWRDVKEKSNRERVSIRTVLLRQLRDWVGGVAGGEA